MASEQSVEQANVATAAAEAVPAPTMAERRRVPRVAVDGALECQLEVRTRIRLVDISLTGALLSSEAHLPVGTRAHLQAGVGAAPFSPDVQVQRIVDRASRDAKPALGAVFVGMDEKSRRSLEEFLRKASE
jgi:c-di-GMP-binding flagellar brake protein YcgR